MNTEAIYKILNMLKSFLELLKKDMTIETLTLVRELKGSDILENYEKMFDIDGVGTKNNLRNYIINEINSLSIGFMEVSKYDGNEIKTYIGDKLDLPEIDIKKLNFVTSKFEDDDAFNLITHKLSLLDYYNKLAHEARYLELLKTDDYNKVNLKDIINKYNIILDMIKGTDELVTFNIDGTYYGFGVDENEPINIKDYIYSLKNNLGVVTNKLSTAVSNIKSNIEDVDYRPSLGQSLRENFMVIVDEYTKGIISTETYDYLYKKQLDIMEFYIRTILAYITTTVSYLEYISGSIDALKDVDNAINISYDLFDKNN